MNKYQVLEEIAKFADYGECVVVTQSDWDSLVAWVKSLPEDIANNKPDFFILPVIFSKDEED